jgi:pimeloyl-ACP methyl ester carboxylesterase
VELGGRGAVRHVRQWSLPREGAMMPPTDDPPAMRVTSPDGTAIAVWHTGGGSPLVMVHGVTADHTRWQPLLPWLEPYVTVYTMDRRGRGASGDHPEYDLAREWEDVAAVVDAVADAAGSPVDLYGHSYGGLCAYGAATLTRNLRRLVLYEGWPSEDPSAHALLPGVGQRLAELLAAGEHDAVVEALFRGFGATDEEIAGMRAQPSWRARVAGAPTIPRELAAAAVAHFDPGQAATITVPTLLLTGADSEDPAVRDVPAVAAALPDARVEVIAGQGHLADVLAPEFLAGHLLDFLGG